MFDPTINDPASPVERRDLELPTNTVCFIALARTRKETDGERYTADGETANIFDLLLILDEGFAVQQVFSMRKHYQQVIAPVGILTSGTRYTTKYVEENPGTIQVVEGGTPGGLN